MGAALGPDFPRDIALAVSGGGDSMAMLTLAHNWSHRWGVSLHVVTVDHGLRPESPAEVDLVKATCAELGHPHTDLSWRWNGQGNLMDAARRGRLAVIGDWLARNRPLLQAHTRDDVAETFLMRLARGSGVDGLAAMAAVREVARDDGTQFTIVRPCLGMGREELRHYLRTLKGTWAEDPSNADDSYERARIRKLLPTLKAHGLDPETLSATARRMSRAGEALRLRAAEAWDACGSEECALGTLTLDRDAFARIERDTQLRVLAAALRFVSRAEYRPRAAALETLLDRLHAGGSGTLHGCELRCGAARITILRELAALAGPAPLAQTPLWDGRWRMRHPDAGDLTVRALGDDGWQQAGAARANGPVHAIARTLPSLWQGHALVACDGLGIGPGATATLVDEAAAFRLFILSR
ncbi:tRNA(Ile)-lysidine synthetase [Salipiger aestuarii]|nr:tRNA(Ile)-lysidine synthetase [Salipiger aestuarii]KAA8609394.1 tRNA(Ile)-lysidine synthetase [Salipiger aestuarii]KAB2540939.1 tRNA(Ile)-lysidine synthetase [Salipiger aestuarii]